jgi:hypothetical protein
MNEQTKYAFSSASDTSKQLITLSTAVLALQLTFVKDIASCSFKMAVWPLAASWVFLFISIIAGVVTLMALTGSTAQKSPPKAIEIYCYNIKIPVLVQIFSFLLGILSFVIYAMKGMIFP